VNAFLSLVRNTVSYYRDAVIHSFLVCGLFRVDAGLTKIDMTYHATHIDMVSLD